LRRKKGLTLIDVEQVTQGNLLNHIEAIMWVGPMVTIAQGFQGIGLSNSLLTWNP